MSPRKPWLSLALVTGKQPVGLHTLWCSRWRGCAPMWTALPVASRLETRSHSSRGLALSRFGQLGDCRLRGILSCPRFRPLSYPGCLGSARNGLKQVTLLRNLSNRNHHCLTSAHWLYDCCASCALSSTQLQRIRMWGSSKSCFVPWGRGVALRMAAPGSPNLFVSTPELFLMSSDEAGTLLRA